MYKSLYITTTEPRCGKSLVSLGLCRRLLRRTQRLAVFRPIISSNLDGERDKNIDLLLSAFQLDIPYEDTYVFTDQEAIDLLARKEIEELINRVIKKYTDLESRYDFILCIGSDIGAEGMSFDFDTNVAIAHAIGSPVLILTRAAGNDQDTVVSNIHQALDAFQSKSCPVVGVVVNRAETEQVGAILETLERVLPQEIVVSVIPEDHLLASPTLKEIADHLGADVLYGHDQLDRLVPHYQVIAMHMQNYLSRLKDNALLITPGDRGEVVLSALAANRSLCYPSVAGILLSTGETLAPSVELLLDGLPDIIPILAVQSETYETVAKINTVQSYITADNPTKIAVSRKLFREYVDAEGLMDRFVRIERRGISPQMFLYSLIQRARSDKKHIVLPEGNDERILRASSHLLDQDVVDLTLIGNEDEIRPLIAGLDLNPRMKEIPIIMPEKSPSFDLYAETLYQLRNERWYDAGIRTGYNARCVLLWQHDGLPWGRRRDGIWCSPQHCPHHSTGFPVHQGETRFFGHILRILHGP